MFETWIATRACREVVVKKLNPGLTHCKALVDDYSLAARRWRSMEHANIVRVLEVTEAPDYLLAMERVNGKNLREIMSRAGPLSPSLVRAIIASVAAALSFAHETASSCHGDLRPDNVLIGSDGGVKVVDFFVARAVRRWTGTTVPGPFTGRGQFSYLGYQSPEEILGETADERSEIFILGILAHELLTAERLFDKGYWAGTLDANLRGPILRPSKSVSGIPEGLEAVVMTALDRSPSARFGTMEEMRLLLEDQII